MKNPRRDLFKSALFVPAIFMSSCWWSTDVAQENGGGGTEGVAVETPDSIVSFQYRSWQYNAARGFSEPSELRTWSKGDSLYLPDTSALELSQSGKSWIVYAPPRDWSKNKSLKINALIDQAIARKVIVSSGQVSLYETPYKAKCTSGVCSFDRIPAAILQGEYQNGNATAQFMLRDDSVQTIYPSSRALQIAALKPTYSWVASSASLPRDTLGSYWYGNFSPKNGGWHIDTVVAPNPTVPTYVLIPHGLSSDGVNSGVYRYSILLDLNFDPSLFSIPILAGCESAASSLLSLSWGSKWTDIMNTYESPFTVSRSTWHRVVINVDVQEGKKMDLWVDGWRVWSLPIGLPPGASSWETASACYAANWALYQHAGEKNRFKLFLHSGNGRPDLTVKTISVFQGTLSDSVIASLGKPE